MYKAKGKHPNLKAVYALVTECVNHRDELEKATATVKLFEKEPGLSQYLAFILITELVWGKERLPGSSRPVETVLRFESVLKKHLPTKKDNGVPKLPRYVRVNTLQLSLSQALQRLTSDGFTDATSALGESQESFAKFVSKLKANEFVQDDLIENLLVFPHGTHFYEHPLYVGGSLILQDKASCMPVEALSPKPGSVVLDACAAPGMKTTQLAAKMQAKGKIYAMERDAKRSQTLSDMVKLSGADAITVILNMDFLKLNANKYPDVEYILLDPSCSGSGKSTSNAG